MFSKVCQNSNPHFVSQGTRYPLAWADIGQQIFHHPLNNCRIFANPPTPYLCIVVCKLWCLSWHIAPSCMGLHLITIPPTPRLPNCRDYCESILSPHLIMMSPVAHNAILHGPTSVNKSPPPTPSLPNCRDYCDSTPHTLSFRSCLRIMMSLLAHSALLQGPMSVNRRLRRSYLLWAVALRAPSCSSNSGGADCVVASLSSVRKTELILIDKLISFYLYGYSTTRTNSSWVERLL